MQDTGINQKAEDTEKDKEEESESEVKDTKRKVENSEGKANDSEGEANDSEEEANDIEGETNDSEEEASSHEDSFIGDEHEEPRLPTEPALSSVQQSFTSSDPIEDGMSYEAGSNLDIFYSWCSLLFKIFKDFLVLLSGNLFHIYIFQIYDFDYHSQAINTLLLPTEKNNKSKNGESCFLCANFKIYIVM